MLKVTGNKGCRAALPSAMLKESKDEHIYIVFSKTPYKMGRFIRLITGGRYNHVSVSPVEDLSLLYSFARRYREAPFCGGFVRESASRFKIKGKTSNVMICAVPVTREAREELIDRLSKMEKDSERYVYNLFSAICVPIKKRIFIRDAYTCVEFILTVLRSVGLDFNEQAFYSIDELVGNLSVYKIYEGPFPELGGAVSDEYDREVSYLFKYGSLIKQVNTLAGRMLH